MKKRSAFEQRLKLKEKQVVSEYNKHQIRDLQAAQKELTKIQRKIQNGE